MLRAVVVLRAVSEEMSQLKVANDPKTRLALDTNIQVIPVCAVWYCRQFSSGMMRLSFPHSY